MTGQLCDRLEAAPVLPAPLISSDGQKLARQRMLRIGEAIDDGRRGRADGVVSEKSLGRVVKTPRHDFSARRSAVSD